MVEILQRAPDPFQLRIIHLRVDRRGGDVPVAEELLYVTDGDAILKEVRGEAVAQIVRGGLPPYAGALQGVFEDLLHGPA